MTCTGESTIVDGIIEGIIIGARVAGAFIEGTRVSIGAPVTVVVGLIELFAILGKGDASVVVGTVDAAADGAVVIESEGNVEMTPDGAVVIVPEGNVEMTPDGAVVIVPEGNVEMTPDGAVVIVPEGNVEMTPDGAVVIVPEGNVEITFDGAVVTLPEGNVEITLEGTTDPSIVGLLVGICVAAFEGAVVRIEGDIEGENVGTSVCNVMEIASCVWRQTVNR